MYACESKMLAAEINNWLLMIDLKYKSKLSFLSFKTIRIAVETLNRVINQSQKTAPMEVQNNVFITLLASCSSLQFTNLV